MGCRNKKEIAAPGEGFCREPYHVSLDCSIKSKVRNSIGSKHLMGRLQSLFVSATEKTCPYGDNPKTLLGAKDGMDLPSWCASDHRLGSQTTTCYMPL